MLQDTKETGGPRRDRPLSGNSRDRGDLSAQKSPRSVTDPIRDQRPKWLPAKVLWLQTVGLLMFRA
jgi:hypothetical protein